MNLADEIYFQLTLAGLAPAVPFSSAPPRWREVLLLATDGYDGATEHINQLELECAGLCELTISLEKARDSARREAEGLQSQLKNLQEQKSPE